MDVQDKVVLITGGSEGIGKAAAQLVGAKGAKVVVAARSLSALKEVAKSLPDGFAVQVDMTEPDSIHSMVAQTLEHYGRIDILINNAGRAVRAPIMEIKLEDFRQIMDLNVYGPLLAMQAVVPILINQGGGMIINVSSNVSKMAIPGLGAYAATKYALNGITLTARNELADQNIIVTVMHPGMTDTKFGEHAIKSSESTFQRPSGMRPDSAEDVAQKILEAITNGPAEQYMSEEVARQFTMPGFQAAQQSKS